jgi:hypothetical protein
MKLQEYENLPDGMTAAEVAGVLDIFLSETNLDTSQERIQKLEILCDKQWHTYEVADEVVRKKAENLIISYWEENNEYLEMSLNLCYCFGLSKCIFTKLLNSYNGEQRWEYLKILGNSIGDSIDPYWSLR